jgi:hypothetical protein
MNLHVVVSLSILLSIASVADAQPRQPAQVPVGIRERLSALVPDPPPAGTTAGESPAFYDSSTLYEYMDGAADVFQAYDVQTLFHREYKAGPVDVTVDIFDMDTVENAFGMYAAERSPRYDFVTTGAEGYRNEGILNFFQDRYYIKLAGFGDGVDPVLQRFADAVSERIGNDRSFPALLSKLPAARRKPRTERYLRKDPLGHQFLGPAVQAVYSLESGDSTLMVSVGASAEEAASRVKSLESHFRRTGRWEPAPEFGSGAARGSNSFEGSLVARACGRHVVILLNPSTSSPAFFKDAAEGLR